MTAPGVAAPRPADSLVLAGVIVRLGARVLVDHLDAQVAPGEVLAVMGPSGSGKSSLLHWMIGALGAPFAATGQLRIGTEDLTLLPTERRRIGLMFQDDLLFPHMSVARNLLFALPAGEGGGSPTGRRAIVEAALAEAGLAGLGDRLPASLSGGQRARVALWRALLARPRALLLDEPFSRLDQALRAQVRDTVWATLRARGVPAVIVTHDPADVPPGAQVVQLLPSVLDETPPHA
jgi:putative thiamine transport system ATP-binding protein